MGIKQLNNLLRSKCPEVFREVHLSEFGYQKVSIDVSLYLCKFKSLSDSWLNSFTKLICCLRRNNIHCVFIFDNGHPEEKTQEREDRRTQREKTRVRIEGWETCLEKYERGEEEWSASLDELCGVVGVEEADKEKKIKEARGILERKRRSLLFISDEDMINLRRLFDAMKVSYYDAPLEAETMCADLCKRGIVAAAMSDDTDVLAYGSPVFLSKVDIFRGTAVKIIYTEMLEKLKLNNTQFLDLCIMCGTDYNKNIAKVGCETSYKYMLQYGDIETIGSSKGLDLTVLNYKKSRELFTVYEQFDFGEKEIPYNGFPDVEKVKEILAEEKEKVNLFELHQSYKAKIFFS